MSVDMVIYTLYLEIGYGPAQVSIRLHGRPQCGQVPGGLSGVCHDPLEVQAQAPGTPIMVGGEGGGDGVVVGVNLATFPKLASS